MLNGLNHFAFLLELKNLNLRMRLCFDKICTNINTIYCLIWTQIFNMCQYICKNCVHTSMSMRVYVCSSVCTCIHVHFYKQNFEKIGHVEICQLFFYPNQIIWVSFDFASNIQIYKHQNGSLEEVRTTVVNTHLCI